MNRRWRIPARLSLVALSVVLLSPTALAQDADADTLPPGGTVLEPGRYVSSAVGPTIDFRVDEGWAVGVTPPGPIFELHRTDLPGSVVSVTRFDGYVFIDSCDSTSMTRVEPSVQRLAAVIAGNPYLIPGPPAAIEVDGYPGIRVDAGVPAYDECSLEWVLIWALPIGRGGEFVQVANQQSRFILLDVGGDVIVIAIESFPGVPYGPLLEAAMELVGSMRIEPGEYVPPPMDADASPSPSSSPTPGPGTSPAPGSGGTST